MRYPERRQSEFDIYMVERDSPRIGSAERALGVPSMQILGATLGATGQAAKTIHLKYQIVTGPIR